MRTLSILILLLLPLSLLSAQNLIQDIHFIPPTFYVGDPVEMRIILDVNENTSIILPSKLPEEKWIDIRNMRVEEHDDSLTLIVDFTSFASGTRSLPTLDIGEIQLRDIKISTLSMLSASYNGVRNLRGQLSLPGIRLAISLLLLLIAIAPFTIYRVVKLFIKWGRHLGSNLAIRKPSQRLHRLIRELRTEIGTVALPEWYSHLTDGLRRYLTEKTPYDCCSATTVEIAHMLETSDDELPQNKLIRVLKDSDMVKFAGQTNNEQDLKKILVTVESAVSEWENGNVRSE